MLLDFLIVFLLKNNSIFNLRKSLVIYSGIQIEISLIFLGSL